MSEEEAQKFEKNLTAISKLVPLVKLLLVGAFAIGAWVTTIQLTQNGYAQRLEDTEADTQSLVRWQIETRGNRFTTTDGIELTRSMTDIANSMDKRVTRLEDSTMVIKDSLRRIEDKLDSN